MASWERWGNEGEEVVRSWQGGKGARVYQYFFGEYIIDYLKI